MNVFYIFAALSWLSRPSHTPLVTALLVCHHTYKHREETRRRCWTPGTVHKPHSSLERRGNPREVRKKLL